ncbi:MAG: hypothetical protein PVJ15_04935 [Gammaproteobacteria bacterium]
MPVAVLLLIAAGLVACDHDKAGESQSQDQPQSRKVSFADDVNPILQKHCAECHVTGGQGARASGFRMDSYQSIMNGTRFGPVVDPGSAITSSLYLLVSGKGELTISMPHGKAPLSAKEVETIRVWIENGAVEN